MNALKNTNFNETPKDEADTSLKDILPKILRNTAGICSVAQEKITIRALYIFVMQAPKSDDDLKTFLNRKNFYCGIYIAAADREFKLRGVFDDNLPQSVWDEMAVRGPDEYIEKMTHAVPENQIFQNADKFFGIEYKLMDEGTRQITDLAFFGFLFSALNDPVFVTLCQDKTLNTQAMTLEQKMDTELDTEALQQHLLQRLAAV